MIDIKPNLAEAVAFAVSLPTDQAHLSLTCTVAYTRARARFI